MVTNLNIECTGITQSYPEGTLGNHSGLSGDGPPVRGDSEGMIAVLRPNGGPMVPTIPPLHIRVVASFTVYGELRAASIREDFVRVWARLKREWAFNAGFVSQFTVVFLDPFLIHEKLLALAA